MARIRSSIWISVLAILAITATAFAAWPTRTQKIDMQGDWMIWAPSLAPQCGPGGGGSDPVTEIKCVGSNGQAVGLQAGWVWTVATAYYTAGQRQTLYQAARNAGYTHFALNVTNCPSDFYDGIFPSCDILPARYGLPSCQSSDLPSDSFFPETAAFPLSLTASTSTGSSATVRAAAALTSAASRRSRKWRSGSLPTKANASR